VARVGPFARERLQRELEPQADGVNLRRVLDTVVDGFDLAPDGWLTLTKQVETQPEAV
jgi:hypothetical protein